MASGTATIEQAERCLRALIAHLRNHRPVPVVEWPQLPAPWAEAVRAVFHVASPARPQLALLASFCHERGKDRYLTPADRERWRDLAKEGFRACAALAVGTPSKAVGWPTHLAVRELHQRVSDVLARLPLRASPRDVQTRVHSAGLHVTLDEARVLGAELARILGMQFGLSPSAVERLVYDTAVEAKHPVARSGTVADRIRQARPRSIRNK